MKQSKLKVLIKEITRRTLQEMEQIVNPLGQLDQPSAYQEVLDWELHGPDSATFFVLLPDGRKVNITVEFTGEWDDGAFDHAFGTHRYPPQYNIEQSNVTTATDENNTPVQLDPIIQAAGEAVFNDYQEKIIDQISENPPESGPDPDDQRDRDMDR
jgi:hypothetical protein